MKKPVILLLPIIVAGCAYNQKPVVDTYNVDPVQYDKDYGECLTISENYDVSEDVKVNATNAAIVGTATGALAGWELDNAGGGALIGLAVGAAAGAGAGAAVAKEKQAYVLRECLVQRGYNVLDHKSSNTKNVTIQNPS
ncbi:glycine zipper family protein [Vibrio sp. Of7-15]|uniref:glycine zipper family protein n=1 Tax=Vibrio sp. Of7-15 TaxID=2724879 RepID=UPI001EF3C396|nr:glycine zipper family protein [Vibrio sp. Of7-15]MCG7496501.1 glycine zipper family protein [Vibrio sp. Of7-15]